MRLKPPSLRSDIIGSVLRETLLSPNKNRKELKIQAGEDKDVFLKLNKGLRGQGPSAETRSAKAAGTDRDPSDSPSKLGPERGVNAPLPDKGIV